MDSAEGTWTAIAPVSPVRDMVRSAEFYCRHLGFQAAYLDTAWAAVSASGPPVEMRALETMPWGAREFHMQDIDGCLLRFQTEQHDTGARS